MPLSSLPMSACVPLSLLCPALLSDVAHVCAYLSQLATDVLGAVFNPQFHPAGFRIRSAIAAASFAHENSFIPVYAASTWSFRGDGGTQLAYWDDKGYVTPWTPPPSSDAKEVMKGVPKGPRAHEEAKAEADLAAFFDDLEAGLPPDETEPATTEQAAALGADAAAASAATSEMQTVAPPAAVPPPAPATSASSASLPAPGSIAPITIKPVASASAATVAAPAIAAPPASTSAEPSKPAAPVAAAAPAPAAPAPVAALGGAPSTLSSLFCRFI